MRVSLNRHSRKNQKGATLVVVAIVTFMTISLLVANSLQNTAKEGQAASAERSLASFEASQSGIDRVIGQLQSGDLTLVSEALVLTDPDPVSIALLGKVESEVQVKFVSDIILNSLTDLDANEGAPLPKGKRFKVTSTGKLTGPTGATTTLERGIELP